MLTLPHRSPYRQLHSTTPAPALKYLQKDAKKRGLIGTVILEEITDCFIFPIESILYRAKSYMEKCQLDILLLLGSREKIVKTAMVIDLLAFYTTELILLFQNEGESSTGIIVYISMTWGFLQLKTGCVHR